MSRYVSPSNKDVFTCPECGGKVIYRSPYMYAPRRLTKARIQVVDSWNILYSTGIYLLTADDVPKEEIEAFANERVHFQGWPLYRLGVLWSKETWDD